MVNHNSWNRKRVMVTGSNGFLGATLLRLLVDAGAEPIGFDLTETSPCLRVQGLEGQVRIVEGSITDLGQVQKALGNHRVEVCFHLAGLSKIDENSANPLAAFDANTRGTWIVLEACRRPSSISSFVHASTNHAYGHQEVAPFPETAPLNPLDVYGVSKSCADLIVRTFALEFDLPCVAVRNTNSYGPGDPHLSHVIAGTIVSLLRGERPVIRSDGSPTKAYLFSQDTMEGYMLLAEHAGRPGIRGEAFNLTPEDPISVLDLVNLIVKVSGRPELAPVVERTDLSQQGSLEHLSGQKIQKSLGWRPRLSLEEGLSRTHRWYENHGIDAWLRE